MANILFITSKVCFTLAAIFLVISVFIWFRFHIPEVYGDLSGKTARKSINEARENNKKTGIKFYKPSTGNIKRGTITETMSGISESIKRGDTVEDEDVTGILDENKSMYQNADETELLEADKTVWLDNNNDTAGLDTGTAELNSDNKESEKVKLHKIKMIEELTIVSTDDTI